MDQHLADDVVWHVGGNSKWAGAYQGKANVLGFFARQAQSTDGPPSIPSWTASPTDLDQFGGGGHDQQRPPTGTTSDDRAALGRVRGLQGAPSRLGHVHAYQTISSRRALSMMLKNQ